MGSKIEDIYRDALNDGLLGDGNPADFTPPGLIKMDDDTEDFFTSADIVKQEAIKNATIGASDRPRGRGGIGGVIEEEVHFKRYNQRREHKWTESEKKAFRESCEATIVHDYGERDTFHMSDEERRQNDVLADIRLKLATLKGTYRRVDQYIEAMRVVVQAWEILAKTNYIHTEDEFFKLVAAGKIYSTSIILPKLKKMDQYNVDMIIKYISNPDADPSDLMPPEVEEYDPWYDQAMLEDTPEYQAYYKEYMDGFTDEDKQKMMDKLREENPGFSEESIESMCIRRIQTAADDYTCAKLEEDDMRRVLSPEEAQWLHDNIDNPPEIRVKNLPRRFIKGYDRRDFRSKKKKLNKRDRYTVESVHDILNRIQNNPQFRPEVGLDRSYLITHSMFDVSKPEKSFWDDLFFQGSWASEKDSYLYDLAIREELLKQHPPGSPYLTYGAKQIDAFFTALEENGVNVMELRRKMNLAGDGSIAASVTAKEKRKANRKIESAIVQRITALNDDPKFKKLVSKVENDLNKRFEEG